MTIEFMHVPPRYTVALERLERGFAVSICQCSSKQQYNARIGEQLSSRRLRQGLFFVLSGQRSVQQTIDTLRANCARGR